MTPVTPKSLLLDLLRVAPRSLPVQRLVAVGTLFGFEDNAVRVALTRLVRRGLVESDERGSYRLAPGGDALRRLVGAWREGDARIRPWKDEWLCVLHPRGTPHAARRRSHRALERFGFREGTDGLWLRPDNLRASRDDLAADLAELGLAEDAALFIGRDFPDELDERFRRSLWPVASIRRSLRRANEALERSATRLRKIRHEDALVESFVAGGEAIRLLALDPLLPDELCDGDERRRLHRAMERYDDMGRAIWRDILETTALQRAPGHLAS